jgi:hypothetical protein
MAGLTSFASQAFQILGAANTALSAFDTYRNDSGKAQKEAQKRENAIALQNAQANAETERRAALKRAIARQKASYGAAGIGSNGGSAQAVLLGLIDESEEEKTNRESLDSLRLKDIDQQVEQQKRVNTLQLTQERQKSKYNQYSSVFNLATDLKDIF